MKIRLKTLSPLAATLVAIASLVGGANAATLSVGDVLLDTNGTQWVFVGSWKVDDGPYYLDNPPVYSGQEVAAFLFGGSPNEYAISTSETLVTHMAFMTAWGVGGTLTRSESFRVDLGAPGYNDPQGYESAYSAYTNDNSTDDNENLAFKAVPEPSSVLLVSLGVLGFSARRRRIG